MGIKGLAEAIILQSMEDLWDEEHKDDSVRFFDGEGFSLCADIAGMNFFEQLRLYNMANRMMPRAVNGRKKPKRQLTQTVA